MSSADTKAHKTGPARLLTDEDVSALEAFDEGYEAYFGKMIDYLDKFVERGVKEGRFTEQQAAEDLELSLWYGFAYNNLDIYPAYYRSLEIMKPAEKMPKAAAHGTTAILLRLRTAANLPKPWNMPKKP